MLLAARLFNQVNESGNDSAVRRIITFPVLISHKALKGCQKIDRGKMEHLGFLMGVRNIYDINKDMLAMTNKKVAPATPFSLIELAIHTTSVKTRWWITGATEETELGVEHWSNNLHDQWFDPYTRHIRPYVVLFLFVFLVCFKHK